MTTTYKTLALGSKKPDLEGVEVSSWAQQLLAKTTYQEEKESIDLVVLTPADLGFTTYPTTDELFARAEEQGYGLCPAEVGPRLAGTLEEAGWLYVAMEPITDSGGDPRVFHVLRDGDGGQWLITDWARPDGQWDLSYRIVFRLRKSLGTHDTPTSETALGDLESLSLRVEKLEKTLEAIKKALV